MQTNRKTRTIAKPSHSFALRTAGAKINNRSN